MNKSKQPVDAGSPGSNYPRDTYSATSPNNAALTGAAKAFINRLPREDLVRYVQGHSPQPPPIASRSRRGSSESARSTQSRQDVAVSSPRSAPNTGSRSLHVPYSSASNAPHASNASAVSRSPTNIAALAAARASPSLHAVSPPHSRTHKAPSPTPSRRARTGSNVTTTSTTTATSPERHDETPIPKTSSLVQLYEQNNSAKQAPPKPPVISSKPATIQSPKPVRRSLLLDTTLPPLFPPNSEQLVHDRLAAKGLLQDRDTKIKVKPQARDGAGDSDGSVDSFRSAKEILSPAKTSKPPLPLARRKGRQDAGSSGTQEGGHSGKQEGGNSEKQNAVKPDISVQPPSRDMSSIAPVDIHRPNARGGTHRPSASRSSSAHAPPNSHPSITAAYNQLHPRRMTPLTTGDSLANAIVASSLASSRAPSPHKVPPQSAGRPKAASVSHSLFSRTPSPPKKGMRHTMRSHSDSSSESEDLPFAKHKKKKFLRKHPNKHHEGDRKRWRDAITERERKRYEGVWAANKGNHIFFTPEEQHYLDKHPHGRNADAIRDAVADQVTDIVTRDIWSRSRLPEDALEQVWDLVDTQTNGRLLKEEFVVGLWLIDQCLKGRKLPVKVTDSVWNSVKFLQGIKMRKR